MGVATFPGGGEIAAKQTVCDMYRGLPKGPKRVRTPALHRQECLCHTLKLKHSSAPAITVTQAFLPVMSVGNG